jgi:tetratricopeptide (TPR) repeat protein
MFEGIKRLFQKAPAAPEPGSIVEELWTAVFSGPGEGRFLELREGGYSSRYVKGKDAAGRLELELKKTDLFAWTEAPLYRQVDFVLEGDFVIPRGMPYSACGFLFRYQDERNFYSVLVSNKGFFRFDVVFNGMPRVLVAWTELKEGSSANEEEETDFAFSLRVIAHGAHFTIIVDDEWAAETVDESFDRGHFAFAGQNYGAGAPACFELGSCGLEARPVEVEAAYYRWNYYLLPDLSARKRLAETLFSMNESLAAAVQLRKIERQRPLDADELFLKAETCLRLGLQDEAAAALDSCLALEPGRTQAAEEKANLLYLRGRYLELRDALAELLPARRDNARLLCLSGHARFGLGDFAGAAVEYRAAAELDPSQALFRMNEARAWDQAGKKTEAAEAYLAAARLFSDQEADDDLSLALGRLSALKPRSLEVKEIKAKALYRAGKKNEAAKILAELVAKGSEDSAVHYTLGLVLAERGEGEKALARFEKALELEPNFGPYAFRYAERLFLLGRPSRAAIERALELYQAEDEAGKSAAVAGEDGALQKGWLLNLAGQEALARGDLAAAGSYLEAARAALPGRPEPAINLADLASREGRIDEALAILAPFPDDAACRNQAGNVHARAAEAESGEKETEVLEAAAREYLRATILDPDVAEYQANLAAAYIELERYSEAEGSIRKALDLGNGKGASDQAGKARILLLTGNLATLYGELPRAEAAYRLGLEAAPEDPALLFALGRCYLSLRNKAKAESFALRLEAIASPEAASRGERLRSEIEAATTEALSCASCGRVWRVPLSLPAQSGASIRAMPPDDAPAGACPSCGKVFCIACRKGELVDNRFSCPDCGEGLKLSDNRLRYLVRESLKRE